MGRMKSLGYAYAEHLGEGVDVDWYFESIVNGEIEIPKWFVEEWLEANPIFASEDSEDYEVIMTEIGHTMQRDGETIVFGDVVFATPNDGRSRISSYGQGADKASARQALIDRATDYLHEEFSAESSGCSECGKDLDGMGDYEDDFRDCDLCGVMLCGDCNRRCEGCSNTVCNSCRCNKTCCDGSYCDECHEQEYSAEPAWEDTPRSCDRCGAVDSSVGWVDEEMSYKLCEPCDEDFIFNQEYSAETKSWRFQKRDSSGRFAKGFKDTGPISDSEFMEMNPDEIPLVNETYTPEQVIAFVNDCINDDNFPERMMDQVFLDSIQKVTAAADLELLQELNYAAHTSLIENGIYDDRAGMAGAKRAIFVTDVFLNFKWGQENWAAESY